MSTVSSLKRRMATLARWIVILEDGLAGRPHALENGQVDGMDEALAVLGVRLLSETRANREGLQLRRRSEPILRRFFPPPINLWQDLYRLEQFKPSVKRLQLMKQRQRRAERRAELKAAQPRAAA